MFAGTILIAIAASATLDILPDQELAHGGEDCRTAHRLTITGLAGDVSHLEGSIVVVTGPMAAGKSTIAKALAATFPKGVHVEGDVFRRFIVAGRSEMTPEPNEDAIEQLRLRYRLTAEVAEHYASAGYTVVVEDVVAGALLGEFVGLFTHRPLHLVVLPPDEEAIARREADRREHGDGSCHRPARGTETPEGGYAA